MNWFRALWRSGTTSVEPATLADAPRLALGSLAFVSMCAAVVVLTRTAPATMTPAPAVADASPVG